MKSSISEIKNSIEMFSSRMDQIEDRLLGPDDNLDALEHSDENKGKKRNMNGTGKISVTSLKDQTCISNCRRRRTGARERHRKYFQ
jgi:hypothetical protein